MTPAQQLAGLELEGGWKVLSMARRKPNATGGHFSHGYIVEHQDGQKGFLKALDYSTAFQSHNPAETLQAMVNAYVFEKSVCERAAHLSKIARAISSGKLQTNPTQPHTVVEYLIFELADRDVREHLDLQSGLDLVFVLKALHNVATGLEQLHKARIAHQDLKPSNVLVFSDEVGTKICDLGRAWDQEQSAMHDALPIAGDRTYAPIECLYGLIPIQQHERRFGCDMYHLGSLMLFLFARVNANAAIISNLPKNQHPNFWAGTYEEVLPYVQAAFDITLQQLAACVPSVVQDEVTQIFSELCNPNLSKRGHPKNFGTNQFSLERYISRFNMLASKARIALIKGY